MSNATTISELELRVDAQERVDGGAARRLDTPTLRALRDEVLGLKDGVPEMREEGEG